MFSTICAADSSANACAESRNFNAPHQSLYIYSVRTEEREENRFFWLFFFQERRARSRSLRWALTPIEPSLSILGIFLVPLAIRKIRVSRSSLLTPIPTSAIDRLYPPGRRITKGSMNRKYFLCFVLFTRKIDGDSLFLTRIFFFTLDSLVQVSRWFFLIFFQWGLEFLHRERSRCRTHCN